MIPRGRCHNHEAQPSRGIKGRRDEEHIRTTQTPYMKLQTHIGRKKNFKRGTRWFPGGSCVAVLCSYVFYDKCALLFCHCLFLISSAHREGCTLCLWPFLGNLCLSFQYPCWTPLQAGASVAVSIPITKTCLYNFDHLKSHFI